MLKKLTLILTMFFAISATLSAVAFSQVTQCKQDMEITEPRFGVEAEVGVKVSFSDIGCAVVWRNLQCAMDQMEFDASAQAHDYETGEVFDMSIGHYVVDVDIETPLGYKIAAFRHKEDAQAFVKKQGKGRILTYDELMALELK
jgi:copper chaperone NosL